MKKVFPVLFCVFFICQTACASPWAEKSTYGEKTSGKFLFGLKNSLLGWTAIFTEPQDHKYDLKRTEWEGLCNGIAETLLFTGAGLIHLVTFPVPVDIPNIGKGVLPNLGKRGPPKPWEANGRSKYRVVPASEVVPSIKSSTKKDAESAALQALVMASSSSPVPVPAPTPQGVVQELKPSVPITSTPAATTAPVASGPAPVAPIVAVPQTIAQAPVQPSTASAIPEVPSTVASEPVAQESSPETIQTDSPLISEDSTQEPTNISSVIK